MKKPFILFFFLIFSFVQTSVAGTGSDGNFSRYFIQPEFLIGKTLPGYSNFPHTNLQTIYALSVGNSVFNTQNSWAAFYKYPSIGVTLSKSSFGDDMIFGNAYSLVPFFDFNLARRFVNTFHIKLGLGASYFTKYYQPEQNRSNLSIGSPFTWTFQFSVNYSFYLSKYFTLQFSGNVIHHSNGHTQMPNLGLNSVLFGASLKYFPKAVSENYREPFDKKYFQKTRDYFIVARAGFGYHEFGGPDSPTGGVKRMVYSVSVGGGVIFKHLVKIRVGMTYRLYKQYLEYINRFHPEEYSDFPLLNASNVFVYGGFELLAGHAGFDLEIGVNIFKPFYAYHSALYESNDSEVKYTLKKTLASRLGFRMYLINTSKNPKSNVFIGTYINANFSQADFSQLSIGYVYRINRTR